MRSSGSVLLLLFAVQLIQAFSPLEEVLRSIEYLVSTKPGLFTGVFYDVAPRNERNNVLNAILNSPRMDHVVKYVLTESSRSSQLFEWPRNPSLLIIHVGHSNDHLELTSTIKDIYLVMCSFDPATKVMILTNDFKIPTVERVKMLVSYAQFTYSVFVDRTSNFVHSCNSFLCFRRPRNQHPMYLFTYGRRNLSGRNITYIKNARFLPFAWNSHWLNETARYLSAEAVEYPHNCSASEAALQQCIRQHMEASGGADILLETRYFDSEIPRDFRQLFTSIMLSSKFAVPRGRPLNTAELLAMPFSWQVWALLVAILITSEIIKHQFPNQFKNDPILLVVCGFERSDFHRAGRSERIILFSLVSLMFFMSNAFATKIVSLMVKKPSIQRIRTMDDLRHSGLKLYVDLENNPHYANDTHTGSMVVQGKPLDVNEIVPDAVQRWNSDWVEVLKDMAFDYTRMQPFYVVLDYECYVGPELYKTSMRNPLVRDFRFVHITLVESGLMSLWKQRWRDQLRSMILGRRFRVHLDETVELKFSDMKPAWFALVVGLAFGGVGFLAEHAKKRVDLWWSHGSKTCNVARTWEILANFVSKYLKGILLNKARWNSINVKAALLRLRFKKI